MQNTKGNDQLVYGKVPPQSVELEKAVLGAIMLEKSAYDLVSDILPAADVFYTEAHQKIYQAIQGLAAKRLPIDLLTVVEQLKFNEDLEIVGGPFAITKLTNAVVSAANVEAHARMILQKYLGREIIRIGGDMVKQGYDNSTDIFDLLDYSAEQVSNIQMTNIKKSFTDMREVIIQNLTVIEGLRNKPEAITGVSSGFESLDRITCGFQKTDSIIIAARPSVGKTAFALTLARNAAKSFFQHWTENKRLGIKLPRQSVGIFSLEMSARQLVNRVLSSESNIWLWKLQNGRLEDYQMKKLYSTAQDLNSCDILIDDTAALKIQDFKTKARIMKRKHNVGLIVIDYMQLMKDPTKKMREQEISSISSEIKATAKELEIPIISLSQLSRDYAKSMASGNASRKPQLSDLRESGAIEQDADMVMFLYRPSLSEIEADSSLETTFFCGIEKNRNGDAPVELIGSFVKQTQTHEWLNEYDSKTGMPKDRDKDYLLEKVIRKFIPVDFSQSAEKDEPAPF
jgi:replicative DNA helicase